MRPSAAKTGYDASDSVTVTVNAGSKMTVTLPKDQTGYTLTADKMTDLVWGDTVTLTFALTDGYSRTNSFEIAATNGATVSELTEAAGTYEIENITKDTVISVTGVADVTAPTGMIKVENNEWKSWLNNITFDLFFKETKDVAITGADNGSGVKSVQYYVANKQLSDEEISALDTEGWKEYKTFSMNDEKSYVIYGKITDNAGNTTLICSNGMTVDKQAPVITGITDGETYYTTQKATVADDYLVEVNGVADSSTSKEVFLVGNTAKKYSVTAKDKAGN